MSSQVRIPSRLPPSEAEAWVSTWRAVRDEPELRFVLPGDACVQPTGVVLLAAGIADRQEHAFSTRFTTDLPDSAAYQSLRRVDFFTELGVSLEVIGERGDPGGRFVPLRRIRDLRTARIVADQTAQVLESELPEVGPSSLRMARFILEELGANIVQHSARPGTGFGMAQAFPQARRIEIAFADAGVGFLESLQRNPELVGRVADEGEALQLALGRGLTSRADGRGNLGLGLDLLVTFSDLLGGDLRVASGDALLHRRTVAGRERVNSVRRTAGWRGSWVCLEAELP